MLEKKANSWTDPLKSTNVEAPFVYLAVAGGKKRRELTPIQSKVREKRSFDGGLTETDARRKGSVCSAGVGGDKRTKLGACKPKNNVSSSLLRRGADTADGASTIFLGHLSTRNITACGASLP